MSDDIKSEAQTTAPPAAETASAIPAEEIARLTDEIVGALKTVYDPEIPADIYELGLIYKVEIKDDRSVDVMMTLTTPNCPAAGQFGVVSVIITSTPRSSLRSTL